MKYLCTITVKLPLQKVVNLWTDDQHYHRWQDGFQRYDVISGRKGESGSVAEIEYDQNNRHIELLETILIQNLPFEIKGLYEHKHMDNTQHVKFEVVNPHKTKILTEVEYTSFKNFPAKILGLFFPGMFKKQSQKWLKQFKIFAENHVTTEQE